MMFSVVLFTISIIFLIITVNLFFSLCCLMIEKNLRDGNPLYNEIDNYNWQALFLIFNILLDAAFTLTLTFVHLEDTTVQNILTTFNDSRYTSHTWVLSLCLIMIVYVVCIQFPFARNIKRLYKS